MAVDARLPRCSFDVVELRRVRLPLREPFHTATMALDERVTILVHVRGDDGEGWGECPALPGYGDEPDVAWGELRDRLAPALLDRGALDAADLSAAQGPATARAALETAVLDAQLRAAGRSLGAHLGATRTTVPAGAAVGVRDTPAAVGDTVAALAERGYRRAKVKIAPGRDRAPLLAACERAGPGLVVAADANGSYGPEDLDLLVGLDDLGLQSIEQPCDPADTATARRAAELLTTPVALDETATSADSVTAALDAGLGDAVVVKWPRLGGPLATLALVDRCRARGVPVLAGGYLESGVGRAVLVTVAALPGFALVGDLSASDHWFRHDVTDPHELVHGELSVPDEPGIGRTPDPDSLSHTTLTTESVRAA